MSCSLAVAALLILSAPSDAAPPAPAVAEAPASVAGEPLFADIVARAQALKAEADHWAAAGAGAAPDFAASPAYAAFRVRATELAALNMQGHVMLRDRGVDGDLKCILRGIAEDMPRRLDAVAEAATAADRAEALLELSHLLDDNAAVILAPPAPEA